jgi:hypothetical protein
MNLNDLKAEKISGQLGSNPGAFYIGADGIKRYIKHFNDPERGNVEHLSSQIYGPDIATKTSIHPDENGVSVASEFIPNQGEVTLNPTRDNARQLFQSGFAHDILMSNHDVIGFSGDNLILDNNGKIRRVDQGGTLDYRAKGDKKPQHALDSVDEWDDFLNQTPRKRKYSRFFETAGFNSPSELLPDFIRQYNQIDDFKEKYGGWQEFINAESSGLSPERKQYIVKLLNHRQQLIKQKIDALISQGGQPIKVNASIKKAYNHFHEQLKKVGESIKHCSDYGDLFVKGKKVWWVRADSDDEEGFDSPKEIIKKFKNVKGVEDVIIESEYSPPSHEEWKKLN